MQNSKTTFSSGLVVCGLHEERKASYIWLGCMLHMHMHLERELFVKSAFVSDYPYSGTICEWRRPLRTISTPAGGRRRNIPWSSYGTISRVAWGLLFWSSSVRIRFKKTTLYPPIISNFRNCFMSQDQATDDGNIKTNDATSITYHSTSTWPSSNLCIRSVKNWDNRQSPVRR